MGLKPGFTLKKDLLWSFGQINGLENAPEILGVDEAYDINNLMKT